MDDKVRIRVSLAILLIDDFTGKIITAPGFRASANESRKPIRKPEGFLIFTNLTDPLVKVTVEGPCYEREEQEVDLRRLDPANPILRIRMRPDRTCPLPGQALRAMLLLPPDSVCYVLCEKGNDSKKLMTDYSKGDPELSLYQGQGEREELEGKTFCMTGKNGNCEFFRLGQLTDREKGTYQLENPLEHDYKKIGSKAYPVTVRKAVSAYLPLKSYGQKTVEYIFILVRNGQASQIKKILETGRENLVDLREES